MSAQKPPHEHASAIRAALTDPFSLCESLGLIEGRRSYQRQARGVLVCCPWHNERTPSCSVFVQNSTVAVRCHACGETGDALSLIAAVHQLDVRRDFRRVLEIGSGLTGIGLTENYSVPLPPIRPLPPEPKRLDDDTFDRIAEVLAVECPLASQPDVCDYLAGRGLLDEAGTSLYALPGDRNGQKRVRDAIVAAVGQDAWQQSGLARKSGEWAWYEHRLCIPWRENGVAGVVTTLQRRLVRKPRPDETGKYVFATGRAHPRWPFGIEEQENVGPDTAVAFVEGAMDSIAMRSLCRREGVDWWPLGLPSATGWTKAWAKLAAGRVAIIALDADRAGEDKVQAIAADLYAAGATRVRRERPASGRKDWNEVING